MIHSTYTIFFFFLLLKKCTQFFKEFTQFCIFNIHKFSMNLYNYVYSMSTNFQFYTLNIHNVSKNLQKFVHLMYTIFKFCTINVNNFSNKVRNFVFQSTQFFKEYIQLCIFNIHNFSFSKIYINIIFHTIMAY